MGAVHRSVAIILFSLINIGAFSQGETLKAYKLENLEDSVTIDSIHIRKNWMTWDVIIKSELLFGEGDRVSKGMVDTSMQRVWNIGNFAEVDYTIQETERGNTIDILALDGVQFYPIITIDHSSEDDFKYELGYGDDNFLGSNSKLRIKWLKDPTGVAWNFHLGLPRQLLYKNMTAAVGYINGTDAKQFVERNITTVDDQRTAEYVYTMLAPYRKSEFYVELGNPWHLDYRYRFSPDLSVSYKHHVIDHSLADQEDLDLGIVVPEMTYDLLEFRISESIGTIDRQRHRLNGYNASASYTWDMGLKGTNGFHTLNLSAAYHKMLNSIVQLSGWARTAITSADDQYKLIMGSGDVIGLRYGELYGKKTYAVYAGSHFTWVNTKWVTLENAYFVNFGNGADHYSDLLFHTPKASVGTFFEIRFPVFPIAFFRFTFMYAGPGTEWFKFNM